MRAVVWQGPRAVKVADVPEPKVKYPTDAIIRMSATAICGSDLHLYDHGAQMEMQAGDILGHEGMGTVVAVGDDVKHIAPGDTVVVPFNISCGDCAMCLRGLYSQCATTRQAAHGKGAALFGYTHMYGGVPGMQAEYFRVPQAHFGPIPVSETDSPAVLLLSDVLPTAWEAVERADIVDGGSVAVFGLGPVGQMCVTAALYRGAGRVIAIDEVPARLEMASRNGAECINKSRVSSPASAIRDLTLGEGTDSVIDAVGMDATGSRTEKILQSTRVRPDRLHALHQSLEAVRRGGTVSVIGVYVGNMPNFPIGDLFDRQITLRWGQANVRRWDRQLLTLLRDGDRLRAEDLITHTERLADAPACYEKFRNKGDGMIKVVLKP